VELHWDAGRIAAAEALHRRARAVMEELASTNSQDDDVWAALGRGFELLDDASAVATVLEHRVSLGARSSRPPADAELFYRLATARLADPATRIQGLGLLERAMDLKLDLDQAARLLGGDLGELARDPRVVSLRERVARASGDQRGLVRVLAERAALPGAGLAEVREGIELARALGEPELVEALTRAALDNEEMGLGAEETGWLRLELASVLEQRGDAGAAFTLRELAADQLPEAERKKLLIDLAAAAEALADDERALGLYAKVLELDPTEAAAFRPLLTLHAKLGKRDAWLALAEQTIGVVENVAERTALRLDQARALSEKKSGVKRAIDVLNDLLADDPGRPEAFELLADLLERAGREDELADLLVRELDAAFERGDAPAARGLGTKLVAALERTGKILEAAEICQRALDFATRDGSHDPELARTLLRLAEATGEVDRIAEALERVLRVETGEAAGEIGKRLATLREAQGDDAGAERALELAAAANPEDAELRKTLIQRLEASGNVARATELIQHTLQTGPPDPELLERWATLELTAGNHEQVVAALGRLLEVSPEDPSLYRRRATSLGELHREDAALEDLRRAAALDPSLGNELVAALEQAVLRAEPPRDSELALELVNLFEARGDLESARARLADFLTHKPEDLDGFRRLAALDQQLGNAAEALITLERLVALETGAGLVEVALALADAAEKAERPEIARPALERAFETEPEHDLVRTRLESLYATLGANRELGELLLQQSAFVPDAAARLPLVLRAAEALLSANGDVPTAVRVLEVAREESPASIEAATLLARAYAAAGTPERGLAVLKGVAQANRGKRTKAIAQVYEQIANIHLEEGFLSDALEALSKAFESDNKNARMALDIGRLALELEESEAAQRAYRSVTIMRAPGPEGGGATAEDKAEANFQLAALARKAGDARKARVLVSKALAESPGHEGARTLLAELDQR
jgi:tetratricopeptide (TPR) repeat protein